MPLWPRKYPSPRGLLVFSPVNIYYLSGTLGNGAFWLPRNGAPVLLCRKGLERARLESPVHAQFSFRSYSDLPALFADAGSPLPEDDAPIAAEMGGLPWNLANLLTSRLKNLTFVPGRQRVGKDT